MVKLTEEMIIARTRQRDLSEVTQLNCWGAGLTDVSIVKHMTNVEVISLSVNEIETLKHFQECKKLKELYVRNNKITDLDEIKYLQELPNLRCLWLGENPCASDSNYRSRVLETLPELEKLDDMPVVPIKLATIPTEENSPQTIDETCSVEPPTPTTIGTTNTTNNNNNNNTVTTTNTTNNTIADDNNHIIQAISNLLLELDENNLKIVKSLLDNRIQEIHGE